MNFHQDICDHGDICDLARGDLRCTPSGTRDISMTLLSPIDLVSIPLHGSVSVSCVGHRDVSCSQGLDMW